jgi:putative ABC transport system permease protein
MTNLEQSLWSLGFIAAAIALSTWQKLGLEGKLILAAARTLLQLLVIGFVLSVIFASPLSPLLILFVIAILWLIGSIFTCNQISQDLANLLPWVAAALLLSTTIAVAYTELLIIRPTHWYEPQYLVPLAAIAISHTMNAISIAGERLVSLLNANQPEIETHLCLGASWQQAIAQYRREAIRAGVMPTLNAMTIVALATLPTLLSGQLLGGANPTQAIALEIVILFMLAFTTLLSAIVLSKGIAQQFFNKAEQLIV